MSPIKNYIQDKRVFILKAAISLLIIIWCIGFTYHVVFTGTESSVILYPILNKLYGNVCHQIPAKTISINGNYFFVCARCSGIYIGGLIASLCIIFIKKVPKPKNSHLFLSSIPMLTDILLYSTGIYSYSKTIAFITGCLLGSVGFLYIFGSFENILLRNRN